MKLTVSIVLALPVLAGCATTSDPDKPVTAACSGMQCFREHSIRDIEYLDQNTLVVFVGPQRCAFRMELDGSYCDYGAGPTIDFVPTGRIVPGATSDNMICLADRPYIVDPMSAASRVGSNGAPVRGQAGVDALRSAVGGHPLGTSTAARMDPNQCRVDKITALSDDELLELYTEKGAQSPPPPIGSGQVSVPGADGAEPAADGAEPATGEAAPAAGGPVTGGAEGAGTNAPTPPPTS